MMLRLRSKKILASLGLAAIVGAAACAGSATSEEPTEDAAVQAAEQEDAAHHRRKGPVVIVAETMLEHGQLTEEQADQVRAIAEKITEQRELRGETKERLRGSAASLVRAGSMESEQFQEAIDEAAQAIERRAAANIDALKDLHSLLDPDQRTLVTEALHERLAERYERRRERHKDGFKKIAAHLMLSAVQIDKLKMIREQLKGEHKRLKPSREELTALIDAFEGEDFGKALDAFHAEKSAILRERLASAGDHADTVLSILSDGQRELLADLIERGPRALGLEPQQPAEEQP